MSPRRNHLTANLQRGVLLGTVTGSVIRSSEIARLRPISIAGRPFTEVRGSGGKFLGVAVMASISRLKGARR